jgi:hypothetical protein
MDYNLLPLVRRLAHQRGKNFSHLGTHQFDLPCRMLIGHAQPSNHDPNAIQSQLRKLAVGILPRMEAGFNSRGHGGGFGQIKRSPDIR